VGTSTGTAAVNDTTKNWPVNYFSGKRYKITAGTVSTGGIENSITSNAANQLLFSVANNTDTTSVYAILAIPTRGTGTGLIFTKGSTRPEFKDKLASFRGGNSNTFDFFDLSTEKWAFGRFFTGQDEIYTQGTSYAYNGEDLIFINIGLVNQPSRIIAYDISKNKTIGIATTSWQHSSAINGDITTHFKSLDGVNEWIYLQQMTGTLSTRILLF